MITGKTKSGFEYSVDESVTDNWEWFEEMAESTIYGEIRATKMLLSDEEYKRLKEHCRNEKGIVSAKKMDAETSEILEGINSKKS
nr:MAG TPA: hypothetical protein [Bacteriophage sp.]